MDQDQKFQQRWEYRGKNDEVDSSSDESKSSSGGETVQKKKKLRLPQKEEEIDALSIQQNSQVDATRSVHLQIAEVTKQHLEPEKKTAVDNESKRNWGKKRKRKVNNTIQDQEPALLDDFKLFTESLLKDLKVAREKMFVQMKKQMTKLVAANPVTRQRRTSCLKKSDGTMHQTGNRSGKKSKSCCDGLGKGYMKDNLEFDSGKCSKANRKRINRKKTSLESTSINKSETLVLPGKRTIHLVKDSDQIGSSAHLTLPTVLPKPQTKSLSTDSSLFVDIQPVNNANNAERENSLFDENNHYSYLLGIQPDEQFGSLVQTSKNLGFLDQQSSQMSSMVYGISAPLHERSNNGFNITSRSALENPDQENSKVGLRMNGGAIGFPGRSPALSECFVTNTISSNINCDADGGLLSFRSREIRGERL